MAEFTGLIPQTYSYIIDNSDENKKVKATKKFAIK